MSYRPYPGQYQQPVPQPPQYPQYPPQYPPQYYKPPRPRRPKSGSAFVAMILAIVVVILLGVALYMPWWGMKMDLRSGATTATADCEFNLYESKMTVRSGGQSATTTEKHEDDIKTVFDITLCFTIIALVLWIVAIICAVLVGLGVLRPGIGAIPIAIGLVFAIITPIYFAFALPPAAQSDINKGSTAGNITGVDIKAIFGSATGNMTVYDQYNNVFVPFTLKMSWAPTFGWYLAIVALVMGGIALGLVVKRPRAAVPYPQYRPAPVQPQYQQYPQPPPYYPPPR